MDIRFDMDIIKGGIYPFSFNLYCNIIPDDNDDQKIKNLINQYNPMISIYTNISDSSIYISGFSSKMVKYPELLNILSDKYKNIMKGLGYACLCWLLQKITKFKNLSMNTDVKLIASGYIPNKDMSRLIIYYSTMGFNVEMNVDGNNVVIDSTLLSSLKDVDISNLDLSKFSKSNRDNQVWKDVLVQTKEHPKIMEYIFGLIKQMLLLTDVNMSSTLQTILNNCIQSKINKEKQKIICSDNGLKINILNFINNNDRTVISYKRNNVPESLSVFFN